MSLNFACSELTDHSIPLKHVNFGSWNGVPLSVFRIWNWRTPQGVNRSRTDLSMRQDSMLDCFGWIRHDTDSWKHAGKTTIFFAQFDQQFWHSLINNFVYNNHPAPQVSSERCGRLGRWSLHGLAPMDPGHGFVLVARGWRWSAGLPFQWFGMPWAVIYVPWEMLACKHVW